MDWAAKNGHFKIIKFLHENRQEGCTSFALEWAEKYNHNEIIKYLNEVAVEVRTQ